MSDGTIEVFGKVCCAKCGRHLTLHEFAHGQCRGCGVGIGRTLALGRRNVHTESRRNVP